MDCGIITKDVKLCINFSKTQVIEEFNALKEVGKHFKKKDGIDLGLFIFGVGYVLRDIVDSRSREQ